MKILLLGKDGQVGIEAQRALAPLGHLVACGREEANLTDNEGLRSLIRKHQPDAIVNAAAYTAVDKAETDVVTAQQVNALAVATLAEEALACNAWLIHYSTDYIFDGTKKTPYVEDDEPSPLSVYGATKLAGEMAIADTGCKNLIFRTSWVYANHGANFPKKILQLAAERDALNIIDDQIGAPTSAALVAAVTARALNLIKTGICDNCSGTYHLAASGFTSWYGFTLFLLEQAELKGMKLKCRFDNVNSISSSEYQTAAARPANSRLDTTKLSETFSITFPTWREHAELFVATLAGKGPSEIPINPALYNVGPVSLST